MFTDNKDNYANYNYGSVWQQAFAFLETLCHRSWPDNVIQDFEVADGKVHVDLLSYKTNIFRTGMYKSRKNHICIETVFSGQERIEWLPISALDVNATIHFKEMDVYQTRMKGQKEIVLFPQQFAVFFPDDAYMNRLSVGETVEDVIKAVVIIPLREIFMPSSLGDIFSPIKGVVYENAVSF